MERERFMYATLVAALGMLVLGTASCAGAQDGTPGGKVLAGGGHAEFGADLDADGNPDGSYFGLAVDLSGEEPQGHFVCAMWGNTKFMGLPVMGVEGTVEGGSVAADGTATLRGTGTVDLGSPDKFYKDVPFEVRVKPGGPGEGTLQLTVIGTFDGVPGDSQPGNGNYDLPVETIAAGQIVLE